MASLKQLSSIWSLEVEDVNDEGCQFLDLSIRKGKRWRSTGFLDTSIFHKESSQQQILAVSSLHPAHTHRAWIQGMVSRSFRLCNSRNSAAEEIARLKRMVGQRMGMKYAEALVPCSLPAPSHRLQFSGLTSRIVLPFFRHWWYGSLGSILKKCVEKHRKSFLDIFGKDIRIQICFQLQAAHLHVRLLHMSNLPAQYDADYRLLV